MKEVNGEVVVVENCCINCGWANLPMMRCEWEVPVPCWDNRRIAMGHVERVIDANRPFINCPAWERADPISEEGKND